MSEHCRFVAAQNWPAVPYWLYGVAIGGPVAPLGGLMRAFTPAVADSGCGTPGSQRLLSTPVMPDWPSEQKPSRPPMSPMPGTEHRPPLAGAVAASVVAGIALCPPLAMATV